MKVVSTEALTKLIQLIKSSFISVDDTEQTSEIETETPSEITLATVATTGDYDDLTNKPTAEDVGALPVTGGSIEDSLNPDYSIQIMPDYISGMGSYSGSSGNFNIYSDGSDFQIQYSDGSIYHDFRVNQGTFEYNCSDGTNSYQISLDPNNGYFEIPTPQDNYSDVANEAAINAEWLKTYAMPLKADVDLSNTNLSTFATKMNTAGIRTIVETYLNGASWYRIWSDGWCEQGGIYTNMSASSQTVNLLVEMADTNYTVETVLEQINSYEGHPWAIQDCPNVVQSKTVSSFSRVMPSSASKLVWKVNGMSAQS